MNSTKLTIATVAGKPTFIDLNRMHISALGFFNSAGRELTQKVCRSKIKYVQLGMQTAFVQLQVVVSKNGFLRRLLEVLAEEVSCFFTF